MASVHIHITDQDSQVAPKEKPVTQHRSLRALNNKSARHLAGRCAVKVSDEGQSGAARIMSIEQPYLAFCSVPVRIHVWPFAQQFRFGFFAERQVAFRGHIAALERNFERQPIL